MPDLFPTTEEAAQDQAREIGIVSHLGPGSFKPDCLRPFFEYRSFGLEHLTGGKVGAPRRTHTLDFQFLYVLKGWAIFDYEGYGARRLVVGSTVYQPPGVRHKAIAHFDDFEVLEITMPAEFETQMAE